MSDSPDIAYPPATSNGYYNIIKNYIYGHGWVLLVIGLVLVLVFLRLWHTYHTTVGTGGMPPVPVAPIAPIVAPPVPVGPIVAPPSGNIPGVSPGGGIVSPIPLSPAQQERYHRERYAMGSRR